MTSELPRLTPSSHLRNVRYDIRGPIARRAHELERQGETIVKLNIGNPGAFGFRAPEAMQRAIAEHLPDSDAYCHQKGIFPAREAIAASFRARGVEGVTIDDVFMGNGVSELILMCMEALLEPDDEVLLPAPDYPLWTASVVITGAHPVYYGCRPEAGFVPDPEEMRRLVSPRTRAIVLINPNNPTGAAYPRAVVEAVVRLAEEKRLVLFADEIYDQILFDDAEHTACANLCRDTLCCSFNGLSKVWRACGYRTGWGVFSGRREHASEYFVALETLSSLRLCSNVPGQWAVMAALSDGESIRELTRESGRLGRQRRAILDGVRGSKHLELVAPKGALYAFVKVKTAGLDGFTDQAFAMRLLEEEHVLVVPGSSFNVPYTDHFRTTLLPDEETMRIVFGRIEALLDRWPARPLTA